MQNIIKKVFKSKLILWGIIPLFLVLLWFGLTMVYIVHVDTSFSVLSYNYSRNSFLQIPKGKLLKGESVSGVFQAADNNLGIVSVRFQTFFRPAYANEDKLLFQIKQEGAKEWYYQNTYRDGLVYDIPFFPFGFPVIRDSKGQIYEFKITSLEGNNNNSVAVSSRNQILATKYQYKKSQLLHKKQLLFSFFAKKFVNAFQTTDVLFSSLVYLLPLVFYILLLSPMGNRFLSFVESKLNQFGQIKLMKQHAPTLSATQRSSIFVFDILLLGMIAIDALWLQLGNSFVYILIPMLWIVIQSIFGFTSKKTFIISVAMLCLPPIFLQFSLDHIAEDITAWIFLFFGAGLIQSFIELRQKILQLKVKK